MCGAINLLTEGWCYLRDLPSGASFLIWHCSALTGSRVWVPPTESETTNHHKDKNREAVLTEISPSSEIGVQAGTIQRYIKWLTEFHCWIWTSPWLEWACWHVCASYTQQYSAWRCWRGWLLGSVPQSSRSLRNRCPANNCHNTRSKVNQFFILRTHISGSSQSQLIIQQHILMYTNKQYFFKIHFILFYSDNIWHFIHTSVPHILTYWLSVPYPDGFTPAVTATVTKGMP